MEDRELINRWRLILGKDAQNHLDFDQAHFYEIEETLEYLYERGEQGEGGREKVRTGGSEGSQLTAINWIDKVRTLFPKETVEKIERHALERFELLELLTDEKTLRRMEPNQQLLKMILSYKSMMKKEVLVLAKKIVEEIVKEITKKLETEVSRSILGKINKNESSQMKLYRNFDIKKTIVKNLKNYDVERQKLMINQVYFNSNIKRKIKYNLIICVDESGSMLDSVIYSAIMASIFAKLPVLDIKLVIFDTEVVDLSEHVEDPVETLMSIQLGGGTNIAKAVEYCSTLVENPERTIMILITDLFEGGSINPLYRITKDMIDSGVKFITLTALDDTSEPCFDRTVAKNMADLGSHVGAMTPSKLSEFIGEIIK